MQSREVSTLRVFASVPMRNREQRFIEDEFIRIRMAVSKRFKDKWVQIIPTLFLMNPPETCKNPGTWYLGKSLEKMSEADLVVFSKDWKGNRGCEIEHTCAERYGFTILELTSEDYNRD